MPIDGTNLSDPKTKIFVLTDMWAAQCDHDHPVSNGLPYNV